MKRTIAFASFLLAGSGVALAQPETNYQENCIISLETQGADDSEAKATCQCLNDLFTSEPALYDEARALQTLPPEDRQMAASARYKDGLATCGISRL